MVGVIQNVDFAAVEICRQKRTAIQQRETFVNGSAAGVIEGDRCRVAGAGPDGHQAIFRVKNKLSAAEAAPGIRYGSRRGTGSAAAARIFRGSRYGDHERSVFVTVVVIKR